MKLNVTPNHFNELLNKGLSLDYIFLLKLVEEGADVEELKKLPKIDILLQSLYRKGYLFDNDKISTTGKELLVFIESKDKIKLVKKKADCTEFDSWWEHFPSTSEFTYKGKTFSGDRAMRVKKDECRTKLSAILLEGEYTIDEMIGALDLEVQRKKESSYKEGTNKLKFMHNSLTYLNQRDFEPFIELIKQGVKVKEEQPIYGDTDI